MDHTKKFFGYRYSREDILAIRPDLECNPQILDTLLRMLEVQQNECALKEVEKILKFLTINIPSDESTRLIEP